MFYDVFFIYICLFWLIYVGYPFGFCQSEDESVQRYVDIKMNKEEPQKRQSRRAKTHRTTATDDAAAFFSVIKGTFGTPDYIILGF